MEQFSLDKWLENPSRKIVTRDGRPVRIVCWDAPTKNPIYGFVEGDDGITSWRKDGRFSNLIDNVDLFFADEEKEMMEFDKALLAAFNSVAGKAVMTIGIASFEEDVDEWSKPLLDLARKEILKDLPKWKKATEDKEFDKHVLLFEDEERVVLTTELYKGEYYIEVDDLKTLPKEK